jgi:16S rRNA (guanine527-N7)-methyltransferase
MIADEDQAKAWIASFIDGDEAASRRLQTLVELLGDENGRQNLVSAASLSQVWQRHIADSAQLLAHVPRETPATWLDLGTGAGFPGLVIAALRPELRVTMVESRAKRIEWLQRVVRELGLTNAEVAGTRLEQFQAAPVDVISARAFAPLRELLTLALRFSTSATIWLLPKGRSAAQELKELSGWTHRFHVEPSLTDPEAGIVVGTLADRKGPHS